MTPKRAMFGLLVVLAVAFGGALAAPAAQQIPTPERHFGERIGDPGVLIRHGQILEYYQLLAEQSDRVEVHVVGESTEGRPFYYALISSPANLARIDELLEDNARLYDPRGLDAADAERIVREGKTFVIVNEQIHSTEVGVSQGGILLAHRLAAGDDEEVQAILENVVIAHVPVHNPDGQERVYEWLDEQRDTPYQNSPPPFLYQKYVGHDNNRDWYMFSQAETRLSIAMQNRFRPQFTLDQHQQGSNGSRLFVPPFEDPWEPNVDPALIASNNMIGTFMGQYMTARGYSGVEWKQRYDAWTPARAYYHTHGGVRILTEVASSNYADDLEVPFDSLDETHQAVHWFHPMPWPGGDWRFADVVEYSYQSAMAALRAASDLREHLLRGMLEAQRRSVVPPAAEPVAFIIPAEQVDLPATHRLIEVLQLADVEVERATADFAVDGRDYGAGSFVVRRAQPAGRFAKSVLERQVYPRMFLYEGGPIDPPYDVTAHTLPLLMNVEVAAVDSQIGVATEPLMAVSVPAGGIVGAADGPVYLFDSRVTASYSVATQFAGRGLMRATEGFIAADREWAPGTWIFAPPAGPAGVGPRQDLLAALQQFGVRAWSVEGIPAVGRGWVAPARVGLYQSYVASMPEGWTRFVFEQYGIPYDTLTDADIRAGDLAAYGVVILPPGNARAIVDGLPSEGSDPGGRRQPPSPPAYSGGIGDEGVAALRAYVEQGGTLLTWAGATEFATRYLGAPESAHGALARTEFNIPGSLLRTRIDTGHWLGYGLSPETPVFFWNSPFWNLDDDPEAIAVGRYPGSDLLLSGWIQGEQYLAGNASLVELPVGDGRVVMVGFSPEYRAQAHGTFKVIFNTAFRPRPDPEF